MGQYKKEVVVSTFVRICLTVSATLCVPGQQKKRRMEKGGKPKTSQAGSIAASRAAVGQFLSISREAFILRTRFTEIG